MEDHLSAEEESVNTIERIHALKDIFIQGDEPCDTVEKRKKIVDYLSTHGEFLLYIMAMEKSQRIYCEDIFRWDRLKIKDYEAGRLQITEEFRSYIDGKLEEENGSK
ncbi:hypothetical protein [Eubacterium maltosivorans]|uniref:hypothetical protein n=1 Tax=Eubacterium maltosivorans TaxID=2041044 RepID=UPI0018A00083|nr:hypothetical protein [Eubacterium maltosivorans]